MAIGFHSGWLSRFPRHAGAIFCTVLLALCGGCPNMGGQQPPPDNGNDNVPPDGVTTAEIISPSTGFDMSAHDLPVSVLYSVDESATDVRGFRIPVADGSLNSAPIPDSVRVITATNLAVGVHQFFSFDPQEAGVGFFRVGIEFSLNGVEDDAESQAVIQVQGSPAPVFIQPTQTLMQVSQGTDVFISFDCRDPEGIVQWRLFYLSDPADQLGTGLATGSGNVGMFTLPTDDLVPGDYQLGVSATDSGESVAVTVANGESDRIVTIPNLTTTTPIIRVIEASVPMPPTIAITAPGATNVTIPSGGSFTIRFTGTIQPGATGTIDVFYDTDLDVVNGGLTFIAEGLSVSDTSVPFPANVTPGTYFIGATIFDGINDSVTDYATGKLIVTP